VLARATRPTFGVVTISASAGHAHETLRFALADPATDHRHDKPQKHAEQGKTRIASIKA
jgi:hypothetical protein